MSAEEEIRARYGIPRHVPVRDSLPTEGEIAANSSFLIRLADVFGARAWMWKSLGGRILAVIICLPAISGVVDWWVPRVTSAFEVAAPYLNALTQDRVRLLPRTVAFEPSAPGSHDPMPHIGIETDALIVAPQFSFEIDAPSRVPLWRILNARFYREGGEIPDGPLGHSSRWLSAGAIAMYAAESLQQAILESPIGRYGADIDIREYVAVRLSLPAGIPESSFIEWQFRLRNMGMDWTDWEGSQKIGDQWLSEGESCILRVPSRQTGERLCLINLKHPHASFLQSEQVIRLAGSHPDVIFVRDIWRGADSPA